MSSSNSSTTSSLPRHLRPHVILARVYELREPGDKDHTIDALVAAGDLAVAPLIETLREATRRTPRFASRVGAALQRIGGGWGQLLDLARTGNAAQRANVGHAIWGVPDGVAIDPEDLERLELALLHGSPAVRLIALQALEASVALRRRYFGDIIGLVSDRDPGVRLAALSCVRAERGLLDPLHLCLSKVSDPDVEVRKVVVAELVDRVGHETGPARDRILAALRGVRSDDDLAIKRTIADCFLELGVDNEWTVTEFIEVLKNWRWTPNEEIGAAARIAGVIVDQASDLAIHTPALIRCLSNLEVVPWVSRMLGDLAAKNSMVLECLETAALDEEIDFRIRAGARDILKSASLSGPRTQSLGDSSSAHGDGECEDQDPTVVPVEEDVTGGTVPESHRPAAVDSSSEFRLECTVQTLALTETGLLTLCETPQGERASGRDAARRRRGAPLGPVGGLPRRRRAESQVHSVGRVSSLVSRSNEGDTDVALPNRRS